MTHPRDARIAVIGAGPGALAIRRYEETMFPRGARAAAFSERGLRRAVADDAPAHSLAIMTALAAGRNPLEQNV